MRYGCVFSPQKNDSKFILPILKGDLVRFKQIISGLINVCIRLTKKKGTIAVSGQFNKIHSKIKINIKISGTFISDEVYKRIQSVIGKRVEIDKFDKKSLEIGIIYQILCNMGGNLSIMFDKEKGTCLFLAQMVMVNTINSSNRSIYKSDDSKNLINQN